MLHGKSPTNPVEVQHGKKAGSYLGWPASLQHNWSQVAAVQAMSKNPKAHGRRILQVIVSATRMGRQHVHAGLQ